MIDKCHFNDNKSRQFIPYKGWITDKGEPSNAIPRYEEHEIEVEAVLPQKPHEHWKYNLKNRTNELLLPNNVRKITRNEAGYFIVYDDNEEALIEQYGSVFCDKFRQAYWIVDNNGKPLHDNHFQDARPYPCSTILVKDSNKFNLLNLKGDFLFSHPADHIFGYFGGKYFFSNGGTLYLWANGVTEKIRDLKLFNGTGNFFCGRNKIINGKTHSGTSINKYFSNDYRIIVDENNDDLTPRSNIIINGQYLLFDSWYDIRKFRLGLYDIKRGNKHFIINANEDILFENNTLVTSDENYIVTKNNRAFFVCDYEGNPINQEFSSCIWCIGGGLWNINISDVNNQQNYLHGEAPELLKYSQNIIVQNNLLALLEKNSIWYAIDKNGKLYECFRNYKHMF